MSHSHCDHAERQSSYLICLIFDHWMLKRIFFFILLHLTSIRSNSYEQNPSIRRAEECKRRGNSFEEKQKRTRICNRRCDDISINRWNQTLECLWRWVSNRRCIIEILSVYKSRFVFTLWKLLYDIQGKLDHSSSSSWKSSSNPLLFRLDGPINRFESAFSPWIWMIFTQVSIV